MLICHASAKDIDAIAALEALCFPPAEAAPRQAFADRVAAYPEHFYLLYEGDTLLSCVNGFVTDQEDLTDEMFADASLHDPAGAWQMVFGVLTHPAYQRRGYAGMLLRELICDAQAQGRKGCVLTCKDRLVAWYAGFGFLDEGVTSQSTHGGDVWHQMRLCFSQSSRQS